MKQAPEDLDGQNNGATAARAGHPEARDVGHGLAQRIWGRYGGAPGAIPLAATRGLARRITRLSRGRLPLLANLQRRWAPAESPGLPDPLRLAYAQLPVLAGVEGVFRPQPVRPRPATRGRVAAPEAPAGDALVPGEETGAPDPTVRIAPAGAGEAGLGPAIQRRPTAGRAGRAIQRQVAALPGPSPAAGDRTAPGQEIRLPAPTAGATHSAGERQPSVPALAGSRQPGVASLQRQLDGTPGQQVGPLGPAGQHPASAPRRVGRAKPLAGAAAPDVTRAGAGGTWLIQARRDKPYQLDMPLVASAAGGRPATIQAQPEDAVSPPGPGPAASAPAAAPETNLKQETDLEELVDRVLRQLMRRLAIEGERRGWGPWP